MRNAKRLSAWILAVALVVSLCVLVACVDKPQAQELTELTMPTLDKDQMAVIIKNGDKDYTSIVVTLGKSGVDAKTVEDVLAYLKKEGTVTLEWTSSEYGKYITKLGKIQPSSQNEWVAVFTSNSAEFDTSAWALSYTVPNSNVTLTTAGKGISSLSVAPGYVIYFELASM